MGTWLKHDVITVVNAPIENVWDTWSDLDSMSLWMSWIESVKTVDEETNTLPDLTEWTLAANGCLLYTSPSPRDMRRSRMPSSA